LCFYVRLPSLMEGGSHIHVFNIERFIIVVGSRRMVLKVGMIERNLFKDVTVQLLLYLIFWIEKVLTEALLLLDIRIMAE
jgi:hypothetical protein